MRNLPWYLTPIAFVFIVAGLAGTAHAKSSYMTSFNSTYPTAPSTIKNCTLCHPGGATSQLNSYATAYANANHAYAPIAALDSDADGFTNIVEINAGTFPGLATSKPAATVTLASIAISGPASVNENGTASYSVTATMSDNSTKVVTATWSENSTATTISPAGVLTATAVTANQVVAVSASYTEGGITKTATYNVSVVDVPGTPLTDDTEFIKQVSRDFLNREIDLAGLNYWFGQLSTGSLTRAAVVEQFLLSPEFSQNISPVARLYFAYFLRLPDYTGLMYWVNSYTQGTPLNDVSNAFAASAEFQQRYGSLSNAQFVQMIYQNVLGRAPDASGLAYWTTEIDAGRFTRGQVMTGFSESVEYKQIQANSVYVTMVYIGLLRRAPDQSGYDYWVARMNQGNSGQELINQFLTSAEYANRFNGSVAAVSTASVSTASVSTASVSTKSIAASALAPTTSVSATTYAFPFNQETVVEAEDKNGDGTIDTRYETSYFYDGNNLLTMSVKSQDNGVNGTIDAKVTTSYGYNADGFPQSVAYSSDTNNDGVADSFLATTYDNDASGRVLSRHDSRDNNADGVPEATSLTQYAWNKAGQIVRKATAADNNNDGVADALEMVNYSYDGSGRLAGVRIEQDAQNDGIPDAITDETWTWSGTTLVSIVKSVDSNGDTTTDSIETRTFSQDGSGRLTGCDLVVEQVSSGVMAAGSLQASYDGFGNLVGIMESYDAGNDGTLDYAKDTASSYTAAGMPMGVLLRSADEPVMIPVELGLLHK